MENIQFGVQVLHNGWLPPANHRKFDQNFSCSGGCVEMHFLIPTKAYTMTCVPSTTKNSEVVNHGLLLCQWTQVSQLPTLYASQLRCAHSDQRLKDSTHGWLIISKWMELLFQSDCLPLPVMV